MKKYLSIIFLVIGCALALGTSICYFCDPNTQASGIFRWAYASSYCVSLISLTTAYLAHKKQNGDLEDIKDDTRELLKRVKSTINAQGYSQTIWESSAMTELVKFAMFKAYNNKPFDYKIIYPQRPDVVKIIINTTFSLYQAQYLSGHIDDGDILVVDKFETNQVNVIQNGNQLCAKYHGRIYQSIIDTAVKNIEKATN